MILVGMEGGKKNELVERKKKKGKEEELGVRGKKKIKYVDGMRRREQKKGSWSDRKREIKVS